MDDVYEYNNYVEMQLFIDFPKKISAVEKNLPKDILPWERKGVKGKVVTAGQLVVERGVFVCVCKTSFMHACETIYLCMCVRLHIFVRV